MLRFASEAELDESLCDLAVGRAFEHRDRIRTQGGAALGCDPHDAWFAIGAAEVVRKGSPIEINAHASRGISLADILRDLGRTIGEVPRVGRHALDQLQAPRPSKRERGIAVLRIGLKRLEHLSLHEQLESPRDGSALGGVRQRKCAGIARMSQLAP